MDTLETALFSGVVLISGIIFGATSFGVATMFHIGYWTLVSLGVIQNASITTVVVYLTLSQCIVAMGQSLFYWKYICFQLKFSIVYFIFIGIATIIGIDMLVYINGDIMLTRILGLILLLTFFLQIGNTYIFPKLCNKHTEFIDDVHESDIVSVLKTLRSRDNRYQTITTSIVDSSERSAQVQMSKSQKYHIHPLLSNSQKYSHTIKTDAEICTVKEDTEMSRMSGIPQDVVKYQLDSIGKYMLLIAACLVSGFLRGLFGTGGPPMILYTLFSGIDRRVIRVVNTFAIGYASGIPLLVVLLYLRGEFDPNQWINYVVNFVAFLSGLIAGNLIQKYVDQQMFRSVLLFILLSGSINLILIHLGDVSMYSSLALAVLYLAMITFVVGKIIINVRNKDNTTK